MSKELEEYKSFIDELVERKESAVSRWVTGEGFPDTPENDEKNKLLSSLSQEQKIVLANIIQEAKESGIHDTLFYINELIIAEQLILYKNDIKLPVEPFDTELNFDFVARSAGEKWPKE